MENEQPTGEQPKPKIKKYIAPACRTPKVLKKAVFIKSFPSPRMQLMLAFVFEHHKQHPSMYISIETLINVGASVPRADGKLKKRRLFNKIKFLMLIGFFLINPKKGVKYNPRYKMKI